MTGEEDTPTSGAQAPDRWDRPAGGRGDAPPVPDFERLYTTAAKGQATVPWDRGGPHPLIEEWAREVDGTGRKALVVGSGLGPDAELLAGRGFDVVGFDISPTAVAMARRRFPDSRVRYCVADLLDPPPEWRRAFDLVVESLTVQSMPIELHACAAANVAAMVAPGGTLLVVATGREAAAGPVDGPPWPLTRDEVDAFAVDGLSAVRVEEIRAEAAPQRWRAEFRRP